MVLRDMDMCAAGGVRHGVEVNLAVQQAGQRVAEADEGNGQPGQQRAHRIARQTLLDRKAVDPAVLTIHDKITL